jgi:hypothetical protein
MTFQYCICNTELVLFKVPLSLFVARWKSRHFAMNKYIKPKVKQMVCLALGEVFRFNISSRPSRMPYGRIDQGLI